MSLLRGAGGGGGRHGAWVCEPCWVMNGEKTGKAADDDEGEGDDARLAGCWEGREKGGDVRGEPGEECFASKSSAES